MLEQLEKLQQKGRASLEPALPVYILSEMEGQFGMTADDMIGTLKAFIAYATAEED